MLEVRNNKTEHTHENEQFRRVVDILEATFEKLGYTGLLIGNPFNELYYKFRADAILYYDNGIIIIDFKDYQGEIKIPYEENEFYNSKWYNENPKDRNRLEIKAGSRFINPFRQLVSYRNAFRELVETNKELDEINTSRICILNIFSGPISINNEVPRNLPYYKIKDEEHLGDFIYDFSSENKYTKQNADVLKKIFRAEEYIKNIEYSAQKSIENKIIKIDKDVEKNIIDFLKKENEGGILVLESMNVEDRDNWIKFISNESVNYRIPQTEIWCHSRRISEKIQSRCGIETYSIFNAIYGGSEIDIDEEEGDITEIIPLKSDRELDENALIIVTEAHLITRSLNQSELLRFGSGRLLEDIIKFINPEKNRKIVFIGDPYSLSFGKNEDCALNLETLSELYKKDKIRHYRKYIENYSSIGREKLIKDLTNSIENRLYNRLDYHYDDTSLIEPKENQKLLYSWFSRPFDREPDRAVLFYSKKDCLKTNLWIKKNCLGNGDKLSQGDLLLCNNNVIIPDETGFQFPTKIVNGMLFTVLEVKETKNKIISIKQSKNPIVLSFTKIRVKNISMSNYPEMDIWMLNNYFNNEEGLTKNEQIAFRVFINQKIREKNKKQPFIDSQEYQELLYSDEYKNLIDEDKQFIKENFEDLRSFGKEKKELKNLVKIYKQKYDKNILYHIVNTDSLVNAVYVKYGWAITVHKALSNQYQEIIIKGHRKDNDGIRNDGYFRWLYSGISTGRKVNITSPKKISPFMDCIFEDNSEKGYSIKSKKYLVFDHYEVEYRFQEKLKILENRNVIGVICEISKLLEKIGYKLSDIQKCSDYLTKVFYITDVNENTLILNIDNKGVKDNYAVGGIRIEKVNSVDENRIKQYIEECWNKHQNNEGLKIPMDFRNEIYTHWIEQCKQKGVLLSIIESHNNQDIFKAYYNENTVIFRVWYGTSELNHTKGFFNKIEVIEKTSDMLVEKIKIIIFDNEQS